MAELLEHNINALVHGIFAKAAVLPWEQEGEYAALVHALTAEYAPTGTTECYLVQELAGVIHRKKRLYTAEKGAYVNGLKDALSGYARSPVKQALALSKSTLGHTLQESTIARDALYGSDANTPSIEELQTFIESVTAIKEKECSYTERLDLLEEGLRQNWLSWLEDEMRYKANDESLVSFLQREVINYYREQLSVAQALPAIKEQVYACAVLPDAHMEKIQRYEVTLDRKFEKTLSMLLKLQQLRAEPSNLLKDFG